MSSGISILLVEDDDVAAEAVERSLRKHGLGLRLVWAPDGAAGLAILRGEHPEKRLTGPRIVLLDLNMPEMNGFEFLQALRGDDRLRNLVVFVLTTSDTECDRTRAYHEHIAGYMVKSAVGPQFSKLARLLAEYDASVRLPSPEEAP
jgi:CheY-like chemotaxis protein